MALLDDLAARLTPQSVVTAAEIYRDEMPSTPDELVALYESAGPGPEHAMGSAATRLIERPHVQAQVRALRPDQARLRARNIYNNLDGLGPLKINGVQYHAIFALQQPFFLDQDESGRYVFAVNFEVSRDPATSS